MKALIKILAVGLVLLGMWLLWTQLGVQKQKESSTPNTITFNQKTEPSTLAQPKKNTRNPAEQTQADVILKQHPLVEPENDQEMSYMALYRLSRLWRTCDRINDYNNQNQWFDATKYLTTQLHQRNEEFSSAPPTGQVDALQKHANDCLDLQQKLAKMELPALNLKPGSSLSEPHHTTRQLMQLLGTHKTTTDQEQAIAHVIKLSDEWIKLFNLVLETSAGNDSNNAAAIRIMQDELKQLRIQQHNLQQKNTAKENDEPASDGFMEVFMAIEAKEKAIQDLMVVDQNLRTQAIAEFSEVNDQMFASLKSRDPDVFYEAQVTLETEGTLSYYGFFPHKSIGMRKLKQPFIEYVFPEDVLMQALGLNNPDWFRLVIPFATQLYICELGADCGPDSEWIKYHCIQPSGELNAVSCDLDLLTFYQDHLLSQNHFDDVQTVLNVMRDLYAK